MGLSDIN